MKALKNILIVLVFSISVLLQSLTLSSKVYAGSQSSSTLYIVATVQIDESATMVYAVDSEGGSHVWIDVD